jgi:hypothetical protein
MPHVRSDMHTALLDHAEGENHRVPRFCDMMAHCPPQGDLEHYHSYFSNTFDFQSNFDTLLWLACVVAGSVHRPLHQ